MAWSSSTTDIFTQGSPPTLPPAGETFTDPVFGTTILRVTDSSTDGGNSFRTAYSYWPTFNSDNTKILAVGDDGFGLIYDFDPDTFELGSYIVTPLGVASYEHSVYWSRVNPNLMYGVNGLEIRVLDVSDETPAWSTIATYTAGELGITGAANLFQIHISDDDNTLSATVKNSGYTNIGFVAVRVNASKEVYYSETTNDIDEVQIDKSGRWLIHKTGNQGSGVIEVRIIDLDGDPSPTVTELIDDEDNAPGHSDNGYGVLVCEANYDNSMLWRSISAPLTTVRLIRDGTYTWLPASHISMRKTGDDWALISSYGSVENKQFNNELWFLKTDEENSEVRRFIKHYSNTGYGQLPKANVSMDGKFVAFTSNYNPASNSRYDLFIAQVPADMGIWRHPTPILISGNVPLFVNGVPLGI